MEIRLEGLRSGRDGRTALGVVGAWVNVMTPMLAARSMHGKKRVPKASLNLKKGVIDESFIHSLFTPPTSENAYQRKIDRLTD